MNKTTKIINKDWTREYLVRAVKIELTEKLTLKRTNSVVKDRNWICFGEYISKRTGTVKLHERWYRTKRDALDEIEKIAIVWWVR